MTDTEDVAREPDVLYLTNNDIGDPVRGCDRRSAQLYRWISTWTDATSITYAKGDGDDDTGDSDDEGDRGDVRLDYPISEVLAPINPTVFARLLRLRVARSGGFDTVVASGMGCLVFALLAQVLFRARLVVDCHNVESQLSSDLGSPGHYVFARTVERLALRRADLVLVTSERDREFFPEAVQDKSLVVANGFDQSTFYADGRDPANRVLFFGNMNYEPNREAIEVIADRVAPALAGSDVNAEIHVAGPHCEQIRPAVADCDAVTVVGLVDDIAEYIRDSAVVIVPLRTGSGTRLKIIESLACGTPVVSTPKGAEGWPDDWPSLVVTDLDAFPERLLDTVRERPSPTDAELAAFQRYTWESQVGRLRPYLLGAEPDPDTGIQSSGGEAGG